MSYLDKATKRYGGEAEAENFGYSHLDHQTPRAINGKRIALRAVLDCLDKGVTIREIIDACATIEPESK